MSFSTRVKTAVKTLALRHGLLIRRLPSGRQADPFADQVQLLAGVRAPLVLDVGAYRGETTAAYRRAFKRAVIHCFEPAPESFATLEREFAKDVGVVANQLAVSDRVGPIELLINRFDATSSRFNPARGANRIVGDGLLEVVERRVVPATTIDDYCRANGIERVDVLKLDIQGGELAALRGANRMLTEGRISLIYTEVLVGAIYEGQAEAGEIISALAHHGFQIYGLYNLAYGADSRLYQMDAIAFRPGPY